MEYGPHVLTFHNKPHAIGFCNNETWRARSRVKRAMGSQDLVAAVSFRATTAAIGLALQFSNCQGKTIIGKINP